MFDPGKFGKIAAATGDASKTGDLSDRRVRVRARSQFPSQQQFWNTHGLIDKDLFLIFTALAPLQNRFDRNDRGLEFENTLQKQSRFKRRWRIFAPGLNDRNR